MDNLKWFSGGQERRECAIFIVDQMIAESGNKAETPLYKLLASYKEELESDSISVPYTLSRINIDISKIILDTKLSLSPAETSWLKELRSLLNIRIIL